MKPNERLKAIMEALDLSQEELAIQAKTSQPTIYRMCIGSQKLNYKVLYVLKNTYNVNVNLFFDKK